MTMLVVGARGAVGRHVVAGLLEAGETVRASVRDRRPGDPPSPRGAAVEVVEADLTRPATLPAAFDGVDRAFLYATPASAGAVGEAAARAGVSELVLLSSGSVLLGWTGSNAIAVEHRETEAALAADGVAVIPIRPLVLAGNAMNWASSIRRDRTVDLVHPASTTAPVHERDIAAVAVAALTGTARSDPSALLTGPRRHSQREQVDLIAEALGAPVAVREIGEDAARERFARFSDPSTVEAILEYIRAACEPDGSPLTTTSRDVLGHEPLSFASWVGEHLDDFR